MTTHPPPYDRLVGELEAVHDDLYPVGENEDHQWSSAPDYLEWFAAILNDAFGRRDVDDTGHYIPSTTGGYLPKEHTP